ncbi:helix-turn-helix domain-containing protein [Pinisolibacter sp.]|uniref:helix-turn-helix domain-containing protein n=1 Tax=Pinisolibacter sp. TaxID=2172024 RepID=UPI002FDCE36E
MTTLLTSRDLVDLNDGELRIPDLVLADRLGMADPHDIRRLIRANLAEIESFGPVSGRRPETSPKGGRPGTEYLLTEPQAICVATLSRAPRAADVRAALIALYMEVRHGEASIAGRRTSIEVSTDEYIDLLRSKIALLEGWSRPKPKRVANRPLTEEEKAEIVRLDAQGLTNVEIGRRTGRATSTVSMIRNAARRHG